MDNYGFFRASVAVPNVEIANPKSNALSHIELMRQAADESSLLVLFPELSLTGYTCGDLFNFPMLLEAAEEAVSTLAEETRRLNIHVIVGLPISFCNRLYNCALVIGPDGPLMAVPKLNLPNYNEFYEKRWFASGTEIKDATIQIAGKSIPLTNDMLLEINGTKVGIEICEDMWVAQSPAIRLALGGADIIANLSATDEAIGKHDYLKRLISSRSATLRAGYLYASAGWGESSTDLVFSGNGIIMEDGTSLAQTERFCMNPQIATADIDIERLRNDRRRFNSFAPEPHPLTSVASEIHVASSNPEPAGLMRNVDPHPFVPSDSNRLEEHCREIISIQAWGLARRIKATGNASMVIGISGGLDSTLALLVAVRTADMLHLPHTHIIGITMPGPGTTTRTKSNATILMERLGVTTMEIPIGKAVSQHFQDIGQDPAKHDAAFENSQARERTQILMDMANKEGAIVVGTGDLSELALGWCTYNGDQMSMYGVNASVPKTLVKYLVEWFADDSDDEETSRVLRDIIDTPISPELIPADDNADTIAQKTEDLVGPYELHDFFLYHTLRNSFSPEKIEYLCRLAFKGRYNDATIRKWLTTFFRRFFNQQFKRSCMPDGPKVGSVCLSPRGDWRMPSDASSALWRNQ